MGAFNLFGALISYFISRFRSIDDEIVLKKALYAYPITFICMTIAMQLGVWVQHKIDLRI